MSEIIASELKSWFLTLKFEDKDLSTEQIEEEFRRLSPPELRDIWRNIMIHVVPVKEARYIKKVLLLHELNKLKANKEKTYFIPKTVKSLKDFDQFKSCEETFSRLKKCHDDIAKHENEITAFKAKVTSKEMERAKFLNKKEKLDHIHILNDLKISEREKTIRDLLELHAYLNYVNSFWRTEKNSKEDGKDRLDIIKECLRNVNEFSKQRNILPESNLLREKENLMNNIVRLTSNIPISSLHKMVIEMLKEKLSSLLKLADHVNSKQNAESSWLSESKLTELKKECVQYFFKNFDKRKHLQNLHNEIETYKLELFDAMTYNNYVGFQKETFKTWLESECQKQRLVTRENYLRKEFDAIKNKIDKVVNFSNQTERNEFFNSNADSNDQIVLALDQEIMSNIIHLSNEPIDMFISCQQYCTSRIDGFIKEQKSEKLKNFINDCIQSSTNNELSEFKQLELQAILNNIAILETNKHDLSDYYITFCTEQCYYIIYFTDRYNNMTAKFGQLVVKPESLYEKKVQILKDQEKFLSIIQKSIHEAKSNLKNVEKYASECSKNIGLWIDLSVNDIIPKGTNMMVANREFVDWLKRYVSVIQSLRKKSNKSSNL